MKIKNNFYIKKAFTLTEVIIATFISMLLLSFIFLFLSDTIDAIGDTKKDINAISSFNDFTNKMNNLRDIYVSGGILFENSSGSEVFLMKDFNGTNGVLVGPVDHHSEKLELGILTYKEKSIGFRKVSSGEISNIYLDINSIYDFKFKEDQIFLDLFVNEFNITKYNSGDIYDLEVVVDTDFEEAPIGKLWSELTKENLKRFNINF